MGWTLVRHIYSGFRTEVRPTVVLMSADTWGGEQGKDMNALARKMADDPKRARMKHDDLMQAPLQREFEKNGG